MSLLDRFRVSRATAVVIAFGLMAIGLGGTLLLDREPLVIVAAAGLCLLLLVTLPTAAEVAGEVVTDGAPQPTGPEPSPKPVELASTRSLPAVAPVSSTITAPDPVPVAPVRPLASLQTDAATALPVPEPPSAPALARERVSGRAVARAGAGAGLAAGVAAGAALWARRRRRR